MLTAKQLCSHLCYMLHTPVRLYDAAGNCLTDDVITADQEDPLVCDPEFASELLAMRMDSAPVLHTECGSVLYAILPAPEGGVLPEVAYSVADAYTMKISQLRDVAKITKLARSAEIHFLELVQKHNGADTQNRYVVSCKQLIHDRLHQRISAQELADELGLSRSYLSLSSSSRRRD